MTISEAIEKLYSDDFQQKLKTVKNPYGQGAATEKIMNFLKDTDFNNLIKKEFYNLQQ